MKMFLPRKGFLITPILMMANIVVFIIMIASGVHFMEPTSESLLVWGANFRPSTLGGEPWRLLTACFLHIGILHLAMNMYALMYIGLLLEPILGSRKFLLAYFLTGIFSSVASLWWNDLVVSAGASGAIFGMYGVFLAMLTTNIIPKAERKALLSSIGVFIVYNLIFGLRGGVDNAAHIGGLLSGCVVGYSLYPGVKFTEKKSLGLASLIAGIVVVTGFSFLLYSNVSNDVGKYYAKMDQITKLETQALEFYNLPDTTPKEKMLSECKDHGIANWSECLKIMDEVDQLDLPEEYKKRNGLLREYCALRKQVYEKIYKAIEEETNQYDAEIDQLDQKIGEVLGKLNE